MATEILNRAAKALFEYETHDAAAWSSVDQEPWREKVRIMLRAIREPTGQMVNFAPDDGEWPIDGSNILAEAWRQIIGKALE